MDNVQTRIDTHVSPAVWFARILGIVLTIVGLVGFTMTTSVDSTRSLLGFDINLTENIIHLASGVLGLAAGFSLLLSARTYALLIGVVYLLTGLWGLGDSNPLNAFGRLNSADNALHLAIGIIGLVVYAISRSKTVDNSPGRYSTNG